MQYLLKTGNWYITGFGLPLCFLHANMVAGTLSEFVTVMVNLVNDFGDQVCLLSPVYRQQ